MSNQLDLFTDLPRGEQLTLLRRLKLPTYAHKSGKVSGAIQISVLRAIDDHEGRDACFASQATIADELGRSVKTIERAIAALVAQDLITSDRPHRMAPNRHRVVWNSVRQLTLASDDTKRNRHCDVSSTDTMTERTVTPYQSNRHHDGTRTVTVTDANRHHDGLNAPLNANLTDHTTEAWATLADEMRRWGLQSAKQACQAAQSRGVSIELAAELFIEAGQHRSPEPWEPGQLSNWLTGKTPPPIDQAEASARIQNRQRSQVDAAEAIRQSVRSQGIEGSFPEWLVNGITHRKLIAAGLGNHATDAEVDGAKQMEAIDRARSEKQAHRIDAPSVSAPSVTKLSQETLQGVCRVKRVPIDRYGARACEIKRQEINRTLAALN